MNQYKTGDLPDRHYYSTRRIVSRLIGKNKAVLDLGCNDGYLGKFADRTNEYYGVDFLEDVLGRAKRHYVGVQKINLDFPEPLNWNEKFDVIVFADVLEHLRDPRKALRFYSERYLKSGGRVIISLPNVANFTIRIKLFFGNFDYKKSGILDETHLRLYTKKTAQELIRDCNLKIKAVYFSSNHFGGLIRRAPQLGGLLGYNLIFEASIR